MSDGIMGLYERQIELIEKYNSGDESVGNELYEEFNTAISNYAKKVMKQFDCTKQDDVLKEIIQVGWEEFFKRISKYDKTKNNNPFAYFYIYIHNAMKEVLKKEVLKESKELKKNVSRDAEAEEDGDSISKYQFNGASVEDTIFSYCERAYETNSKPEKEVYEKLLKNKDILNRFAKAKGISVDDCVELIYQKAFLNGVNIYSEEVKVMEEKIKLDTNFYWPFSIRLEAFIVAELDSDNENGFAKNYLIQQLEQKGISYLIGSINAWFETTNVDGEIKDIAKGGETGFRESMYKICFALGLDDKGTQRFFNDVVLDKAFYIRELNEFIYYYSLCNGLSYQEANELLKQAQVVANEEREKHTLHETKVILDNIAQSRSEKKLLEYIRRNPQDFDGRYLTARKKVNELIERICISIEEKQIIRKYSEKKAEVEKRKQEIQSVDQTSIEGMKKLRKLDKAKAELEQLKTEFPKNQSLLFSEVVEDDIIIPSGIQISNEASMLTLIYSLDMEKREKQEDNKSPLVCQVIQRNLPGRQLSRKLKDGAYTYEYLRKTLIILLSYTFWRRQKIEKLEDEYEAYINRVLVHCNFEKLYEKNPFDWLMMECAKGKNPLRLFRQITNCIV